MITIKTNNIVKQQVNFWNNIHFHPTDGIEDDWGHEYLDAVAGHGAAQMVRMYTMFEDMVKMDDDGNLVFDFTENDTRMDYMVKKGFRLLVCYNFIPPCIATENDRTNTETTTSTRYKGKTLCTMPPRDYRLWEEVCYRYTMHIIERYGMERVKTWYLHCYNEPDVRGFFLAPLGLTDEAKKKRCEEYTKLYTAFEAAMMRISDELTIGGPTAAGHPLFEYFVKWIAESGKKLDFFCAHTYGTSPGELAKGKKINTEYNYIKLKKYYAIMEAYGFGEKELVIDEWCAASGGFVELSASAPLVYREDETFAAFYTQLITRYIADGFPLSKMMICLSGSHQVHQCPGRFPEFSGFRSFFTEHVIAKPIFNAYRLGAMLKSGILEAACDNENLTVLPTSDGKDLAVLLTYSKPEFDWELEDCTEELTLDLTGRCRVTTWRIDRTHTNPYAMWQREGFPEKPDEEQLALLRKEGETKPCDVFEVTADGTLTLPLALVCNGTVLLQIEKI